MATVHHLVPAAVFFGNNDEKDLTEQEFRLIVPHSFCAHVRVSCPMKIKIIGNGGCWNSGLSYNAFLIDQNFLVETPPDIMTTLHQVGVNSNLIEYIYISHFHGDHCFGLPFFIFNRWIEELKNPLDNSLVIIGPKGIRDLAEQLVRLAFSEKHPSFGWMKEQVEFFEIDANSVYPYQKNYELTFFRLQHTPETHGFSIANGRHSNLFSYITDTTWCPAIEQVLRQQPKCVIADMNGNQVHTSFEEFKQKGIELTNNATMIYGTHLYKEFDSDCPQIRCAIPGNEIIIR